MKIIIFLLFFTICFNVTSQEINYNGTTYKIKGKTILQDGINVTTTLSAKEKAGVFTAFNKQKEIDKERVTAEKAIKKAQKEQKNALKKQQKLEKQLKAKQKAKEKFEKSEKKYNNAIATYEKQKRKRNLSVDEEIKWIKKKDKLKKDLDKAKMKL